VKPGICEQYLKPVAGCGVAFEAGTPICGYLLKNGFVMHEVLPIHSQEKRMMGALAPVNSNSGRTYGRFRKVMTALRV